MEKKMTPCKKLGYKVGNRFEVIDSSKNSAGWREGTIVILHKDDGTTAPGFRKKGNTWKYDFADLDGLRPIKDTCNFHSGIKSGSTITQDGKKYRVTLEEIPQYDFKPGMICRVVWDGSESCSCRSSDNGVVFIQHYGDRKSEIAYVMEGGAICVGYVKTSNLRPE